MADCGMGIRFFDERFAAAVGIAGAVVRAGRAGEQVKIYKYESSKLAIFVKGEMK